MRTLLPLAALLAWAVTARAETFFAIGTPGDGWLELAAAGNHLAAARLAGAGVAFRVGSSRSSETWPYVHPGPADSWAGGRRHTYQIHFEVRQRPATPVVLEIRLWNTHYSLPPTLQIDLNGKPLGRYSLAQGKDDRSLTDVAINHPQAIRLPFAPERLAISTNALALTSTRGSWLLYDSLSLETDAAVPTTPRVDRVEAAGVGLFRRVGGTLKQAVRVQVHNAGIEGEAVLEVLGEAGSRTGMVLPPGPSSHYLLVNPVTSPATLQIGVTAGSYPTTRLEARIEPHRRWTVYVAPSSHTDIGYTDLQPRTLDLHLRNTLHALDALGKAPGLRWNLEVAFQAELVRQRAFHRYGELLRRIRSGEIGLQGLYLNMLTGLCTGEELLRVLEPAQRVAMEAGAAAPAACLNDVPSAVGTLPMLLRHAGVRYFVNAVNQDRGPSFHGAPPQRVQHPFWWEAPDGSRVLAYFSIGYAQASALGITESLEAMTQKAPAWLRQFDRPDYLPDSVLVYGAFSDNQPIEPSYAAHVAEWNRTWHYPRFVLARPQDYFAQIERRYGPRLPVYRGDMGAYWEDGAASSAGETRLNRAAVTRAECAERWLAVAVMLGIPPEPGVRKALASLWHNAIFYDEHTWGAWESISNATSEQTRLQWLHKAAYAHRAARLAEAADKPPLRLAPGRAWIAWNPLPWSRDILCRLPARTGLHAVETLSNGRRHILPVQQAEKRAYVLVPEVPALGYRIVQPSTARAATPLLTRSGDWTWRTPRFVITLDPRTGGIRSLRERSGGREWIDSTRGWTLNQYLYVSGGEGTGMVHSHLPPPAHLEVRSHSRASVALVTAGPVLGVLRIVRHAEDSGVDPMETYLTIHANGDLQFTNILRKRPVLRKEAGYFAFPLKMDFAAVRRYVDLPHGYVQVGAEQLPGACRLWHAAVSYAAVSDGQSSVYLATPDAPLVAFDSIFRGDWTAPPPPATGTMLGYAFNNYWHTNYKASQEGELVFSYTLRLAQGSFDPSAAARFGAEARTDAWHGAFGLARARPLLPVRAGSLPPVGAGVSVSNPTLLLGGLRQMNALVHFRLVNPTAKTAKATVRLPARVLRAWRVDLRGRTLGTAALYNGSLKASLPARSIATYAVKLATGGRWLNSENRGGGAD